MCLSLTHITFIRYYAPSLKLCPHLKFVSCNWKNVKEAANISRKIFATIDPSYTTISLDEASLDITNYLKQSFASENDASKGGNGMTYKTASPEYIQAKAESIVQKMREDIAKATNGLTISAGIAPNRMLAKIASDFNKPNGQYTIPADTEKIIKFMGKLSLRKIPGIGKVTQHIIKEVLGCEKVHEILEPEKMLRLYQLFTVDVANFLIKSSLGISNNKHDYSIKMGPSQKGISNERTFKEISTRQELYMMAESLSKSLSAQMKAKDLQGKTITLKLKTSNFEVKTRAITILNYTNEHKIIVKHVKKIIDKEMPIKLRLMGIRVANFKGKSEPIERNQKQLSTFFATKATKAIRSCNNSTNNNAVNKVKLDVINKNNNIPKDNMQSNTIKRTNRNDCSNVNSKIDNRSNNIKISSNINDLLVLKQKDNENSVICNKCNRRILLAELFEHEDYHVAKEIKRKSYHNYTFDNSNSSRNAKKKKTKHLKNGQQSIVTFFNHNRKT